MREYISSGSLEWSPYAVDLPVLLIRRAPRFETAFDPDWPVVMSLESTLQEIDSFQCDDIYILILELKVAPPVLRRCFIGVIYFDAQGVVP